MDSAKNSQVGLDLYDEKDPLPVNEKLLIDVHQHGSFTTRLKYEDLQKLRAILKRVHMANYPTEMITDREADRIIDVLGPETQEYLIRRAVSG